MAGKKDEKTGRGGATMSDEKKPPYTMKLKAASERSGLSPREIKELIQKGKVEGSKPGKEFLVFWQSLVDHIERNKYKPKAS